MQIEMERKSGDELMSNCRNEEVVGETVTCRDRGRQTRKECK